MAPSSSQPSLNFFKSLSKTFKLHQPATNNDRFHIDLSAISDDPTKQDILNKLRSGSSQSREAIIEKELLQNLAEFEPSKVPEIWYLAKDLISPSITNSKVKRGALKLLNACVTDVCYEDQSTYYIYFNDALSNCLLTKDKVDPNFDYYLLILKNLTDDGKFINHYQEAFKEPLLEFFICALSPTSDLCKCDKMVIIDLLDFIIESIKSGIFSFESVNNPNDALFKLTSLLIKLALKLSDKLVLEKCLNAIDTVVVYQTLPSALVFPVLEILAGCAVLDLYYFELSLSIVNSLVDMLDVQLVLDSLIDVIEAKSSNKGADRNYNASIGASKILASLAPKYPYQINFEHLLEIIDSNIQWNRPNVNLAILSFFNEALSSESFVNQIGQLPIWKSSISTTESNDPLSTSSSVTILSVIEKIFIRLDSKSNSPEVRDSIDILRLILVHLQHLVETSRYPGDIPELIKFFTRIHSLLSTKNSQFVIKYYNVENLCSPVTPEWHHNLTTLCDVFFRDITKDHNVRVSFLKLVFDIFESSIKTFKDDEVLLLKILEFLFFNISNEEDAAVLKVIRNYLVEVSLFPISAGLFESILNRFVSPGYFGESTQSKSERRSSIANLSSFSLASSQEKVKLFIQKTAKSFLKAYVKIFCKALQTDGNKCAITYGFLIKVVQLSIQKKNLDLLLISSRILVRIRALTSGNIYLTNPTDMDGLSAAFARNLNIRNSNENSTASSRTKISSSPSFNPNSPSLSATLDEKWTYPESISYIPAEALDVPSPCLFVSSDDLAYDDKEATSAINIDQWLNSVIQILDQCPHWEIYSFIYTHFCPQLSNLRLFESQGCIEGIKSFRALICDQLMLKLPSNLKFPSYSGSSSGIFEHSFNKHDLQVAIVRNFTPLVSYSDIFSKNEQDQIVSALLVGLASSWEKTAIPCIHILTVCSYEIPLSIKKFLPSILTKLQTRISSAFASAHILEFLLNLSYSPEMTSSFTVDDFKRAFGICFKFIQYAHDVTSLKENLHRGILTHGEELGAEMRPSTEVLEITPVTSIYLLNLTYDIIANMFLNMKLKDRRKLSSFIIKNLILSQDNNNLENGVDNQNLAFIDLITRFTYSDVELKVAPVKSSTDHFKDETYEILSSKWAYGNGIISIDTHRRTGESIVSVRRASGTSVFKIFPDESMVPFYTDQLHGKNQESDKEDEEYDIFSENYMLLQLMIHLEPESECKPIPIPNEISFNRSLANIDRIPVVKFHKVGILYIGPNQKTENEILANGKGSEEYEQFLGNFGREIKLRGCKSFNVGGLDTENDADGEYALGWNDKVLQIIYHTTTMMPFDENEEHGSLDQRISSKKRHIGNDYVNIFFDESGNSQFDFNVIKSQFNFLNIVIQPHSISLDGSKLEKSNFKRRYKVKIHRRSGVPALFATCHFKIISEENLPRFIRTLAIIADEFAQIWHSNGNYQSNWSHRMRAINMLKEKSLKVVQEAKLRYREKQSEKNDEDRKTSAGQSFLDQLSDSRPKGESLSRSNSTGQKVNTNQYEYTETDDNEYFKNLEFTSFTK